MANKDFSNGLKAGLSIAIGYFPVALTFGLLAKTAGLSIIEATAMSLFVYAGASQYIALSLISAAVHPVLIVVNTFIVNIRHFLMTASLNEKMMPEKEPLKHCMLLELQMKLFLSLRRVKMKKYRLHMLLGLHLSPMRAG